MHRLKNIWMLRPIGWDIKIENKDNLGGGDTNLKKIWWIGSVAEKVVINFEFSNSILAIIKNI